MHVKIRVNQGVGHGGPPSRTGGRRSLFAMAMAAAMLAVLGPTLTAYAGASASRAHAASAIPAGPIKLGAEFALTGPEAAFGVNGKVILTTLTQNLNAHGGIDGHKVQLIILNNQGNPTDAVSAAEQLVSDHVSAIIYSGTGAVNSETNPIFMKAKLPVVTYDPTDQWANAKKWPYLFDTYQLNLNAMISLVHFAKAKGYTKLGLLTDGSGFSKDLVADFKKAISGTGIRITASESYAPTAPSVTTQLATLKTSGAQAIVLLAEIGVGTVYSGLAQLQWLPPILGTAVGYFEAYTSLGKLASTTYANCGVALAKGTKMNPQGAAVINSVVKKTGPQPDYASTIINVDNDLLMVKYAFTKDKSLTPQAFVKTMQSIHNQGFATPAYKFTFSASNHDGWPASESHMCYLSPLGDLGTPVIATP